MLPFLHCHVRAELGLQDGAETSGVSHQRGPNLPNPNVQSGTRQRHQHSAAGPGAQLQGYFLSQRICGTCRLWGGKATVALLPPASLHPSGEEGWRAGSVAELVFLSSHRPKIAADLNAGFFSNHFLLISCIKANHHVFTTEQDGNAEQNCQVTHLTSGV